ncbi:MULTISPECIES: PcfJ domain-containing protein [unclassified Lacrimispora]|uniref:PcfJ domain-containing protein n=1 Tax=unclassified Lacrimispora TaxID=2719232 RepID=UPI003770250B
MAQLCECCDDKKYAKFLEFVQRIESKTYYGINNIGTILDRVPLYSNYEQLFSAGIDEILDNGRSTDMFKYTINDIPKALIKLCKNHSIRLSNNLLDFYKVNPNAHVLAYNLEYMSLTDNDIYKVWSTNNYDYDRETGYHYWSYFNKLLTEYGYTAKPLLLYLDQLKTFEALDDVKTTLSELYDYANMMNTISPKFDKYPRHFLTTHKIACRNYDRLKREFPEDIFKKRIDKSLEFTFKDYIFIYPDSTEDIKTEAVRQNNCVASYIDKVIDGKCHILFMRRKNEPDESLVTLEVRNNYIVQAKRRFNDPVTKEDQEAIDKWNKNFSKGEEKAA